VNLGIEDEVVDSIRRAVTEVATNCVLHAYDEHHETLDSCSRRVEGDELVVIVRDGGMGMRSHPLNAHDGRGLRLIARVGDAVYVSSTLGRGTRVGMRFATR
jgi:anti-sigma regulatory factor (Ser/Thr protein kinase)